MISRRRVLFGSLAAAGAAACASKSRTAERPPAPPAKKTILVLGGTNFIGPHIVDALVARGHTVTLFNRGKTHPGLFPELEKLHGDRDGHLEALQGRTWDAVIDPSGFVPRIVKMSAELLAPSVKQYVFISTISVYASDGAPIGFDETWKTQTLDDPTSEDVKKNYGALKAACERTAEAALPGRVANIRPGLIIGPGDPTGRFTHWPVRMSEGGEVSPTLFPASDPVLQHFIELPSVSKTLQREAQISVIKTEPAADRAYEWPPYTYACAANMLVSTPTAYQCCYTTDQGPGWPGYSLFYNATRDQTSQRLGPSNACSDDYGQTGVCGGTGCTYGPNGFKMAFLDAGGWSPRIRSNSNYYPTYPVFCTVSHDAGPWEFNPVTGNQPTGCGCCPNGGGVCADTAAVPNGTCIYSHPNCNTCGGGGAGGGMWDL